MSPRVWTPDRVETLTRMVRENRNDRQISRELGFTWKAVNAKRISLGLPATKFVPRSPPEGFAEAAPTLTLDQIARKFGAAVTTARRWLNELGLEAGKRVYPKRAVAERITPTGVRISRPVWGASPPAIIPGVDPTIEGRAAHHLRRYFIPVCKLRTIRPSAPEGIWLVGRNEVDATKLVEMAEAKGFDAWWATKVAV